jgi:hypothetical protein
VTARLPDLVVVGAPRAGTTTLTSWLRAHPQVAFSAKKELQFFDRNHERGLQWYLAQLPQDPGDRVVAEATPTYLSEPGVAERVAQALPGARFVAVLRDPAARAWSNYWFFRQLGLEDRSWSRALAEAQDQPGPGDYNGYVWRGRYAEQLARWDRLVGRDRLHVVLFEDLVSDPQTAFDGICRFAGIGPAPLPSRESVNPTSVPRFARLQGLLSSPKAGPLRRRLFLWNARGGAVPALPADQRALLAERFADQAGPLQQRLGRPLPAAWEGPSVGAVPRERV